MTPLQQALRNLERDGFALVDTRLDDNLLHALRSAARARWDSADTSQGFLHEFGIFQEDQGFDALIDRSPVTEIAEAVLGPNIWVYHTHLTGSIGGEGVSFVADWHQDAGQPMVDMTAQHADPQLSLKAAYFLTDVRSADDGATLVIPGSHRTGNNDVRDAVPVTGPAGTCLVFDNRLIHSRGQNKTSSQRLTAYIAYALRWIAGRDSFVPPHDRPHLSERERQLLGIGQDPRSRHLSGNIASRP